MIVVLVATDTLVVGTQVGVKLCGLIRAAAMHVTVFTVTIVTGPYARSCAGLQIPATSGKCTVLNCWIHT